MANCGWNAATSPLADKKRVCSHLVQTKGCHSGGRKGKQNSANALGGESVNSFTGCVLAQCSLPLFDVSRAISGTSSSLCCFSLALRFARCLLWNTALCDVTNAHKPLPASVTGGSILCGRPFLFQPSRSNKASLFAEGYKH